MGRCVIISGGEIRKSDICLNSNDFVICADSGYASARKFNIKVDLLVGDFDSLQTLPSKIEIVKLNPIKDDTDTLSAIKEGIKRGFKEFVLYGALGKRIEHSLANLSLLIFLKNQGFAGKIVHQGRNYVILKDESITLKKKKRGYLSIFAISPICEGVYEKNLKYELDNYTLTNEFPIGVDNEYINLSPTIEVKNGTILLIY